MNRVGMLGRDSPIAGQGRLDVKWFDQWATPVDDALAELPESDESPHELLRELMRSRGRTRKRAAVVIANGDPVAVIGLRSRKHFWEPVFSASVSPHGKMPAREGELFPAVAALGVDVWMGGWEDPPPPSPPKVRSAFALPMYKVDCTVGAEEHWRRAGNKRAVEIGRSRTKGFTLEVDGPGSSEWVIGSWERQWRDHPSQETTCADDQLVAARFLQPRNRLHAFRLLHGSEPVAGYIGTVFRRELVLVCGYRAPEYERRSVGIRLFDLVIDWAADAGFAKVDIGGGHAYKARWAPQDGERWYFNVCPARLYLAKQIVRGVRSALGALRTIPSHAVPTAGSAERGTGE